MCFCTCVYMCVAPHTTPHTTHNNSHNTTHNMPQHHTQHVCIYVHLSCLVASRLDFSRVLLSCLVSLWSHVSCFFVVLSLVSGVVSLCVSVVSVVLSVVSWLWVGARFSCSLVAVFVGCFGCLYCAGFLACVSCSLRWAVACGCAWLRCMCLQSSVVDCLPLCRALLLLGGGGKKACMHRTRLCVYVQNVPVCGLGACAHGDVLNAHTWGFFSVSRQTPHRTAPHRTHTHTTTATETATCTQSCTPHTTDNTTNTTRHHKHHTTPLKPHSKHT